MDDDSLGGFEEFLKGILGEEAGAEAARSLRASGMDPSKLAGIPTNPAQMKAALSQFQYLMSSTSGPVNWQIATNIAQQQAYADGDPVITAAQAERVRQAMTVADLWLDTVTDLDPAVATRHAWSRMAWIDSTLPVWKQIVEPIAHNVARAMGDAMKEQIGKLGGDLDGSFEGDNFGGDSLSDGLEDLGDLGNYLPPEIRAMIGHTQSMLPKLSSIMFASQVGTALTALAKDSLGSSDVGLPLAPTGTTALVLHNVEQFADGLNIPFDEILQFLALRECAHQRLFAAVPWLSGELIRAVEKYATHIAIDMEAITQAIHSIDPNDQASLEQAMSHGVFDASATPEQRDALTRLETLLALVEGWVEVVTFRAGAPYLPHVDQLREMLRRRRVSGGQAEQVLGTLIGLHMRPRRTRGAAELFTIVEAEKGITERDKLWAHPDMVPGPSDLDEPRAFLLLRQAQLDKDAEIDQALESLLDGTLGWADGIAPESADAVEATGSAESDSSAGSTDSAESDSSAGSSDETTDSSASTN